MDVEKCDKCGKPATILLTDVVDGKLTERRFCQACAAAEGVVVKTNMSLGELLEDFVMHTSQQAGANVTCDVCGLTFAEFRQQKLLGCPHDYDAFEPALRPLIEGAHAGASQHVGKAPHRSGGQQKKQNALLRLRADLKKAVAAEDYEKAAMLRDQIQELEAS
ncbi:MAG: UvrB/UvrC motif-containing protein [Phycisphaerae bacterium]|nr:UvrB/UvrC motif-containing protein [Phycisphaerae bacterium]